MSSEGGAETDDDDKASEATKLLRAFKCTPGMIKDQKSNEKQKDEMN